MDPSGTNQSENCRAESVLAADATLLEQYVRDRDEASFAALVQRFGPIVLGVCRRILRHEQDAEDAFQATFFVLARRAHCIRRRQAVGSWLYSIAFRMAHKAKAKKAKQPVPSPDLPEQPTHDSTPDWVHRELWPILDDEVNRLPAKYRQPFVLCYLEGKTNEEAAQQLGCPTGTILSRLSRARVKLRGRLTRRGIVVSVGALVSVLTEQTLAFVPVALVRTTAKEAILFALARRASASMGATEAARWAEQFLKARFLARWKVGVGVGAGLGVLGLLIWLIFLRDGIASVQAPPTPPTAAPARLDREQMQGIWRLIAVERNGVAMPPDRFHLEFAGDQFNLLQGGAPALRHAFRLKPNENPHQIDFTRADGKVLLGIYAVDDHEIKICFDFGGKERPADFVTRGHSDFNLFVAQRDSPTQPPLAHTSNP